MIPTAKKRTHRKYDNLPRKDQAAGDSSDSALTSARLRVDLEQLRLTLKTAPYTEESIAERLRIPHLSTITLQDYPIYYERVREADRLALLINLFLLQSKLSRKAAEKVLGLKLLIDLLAAGLLVANQKSQVMATVSIYPCSGCHFITDHQFWPMAHKYYAPPPQPVMNLGPDSYALAYLAPITANTGRVLDLCTGSGVQAILAARHAEFVLGVDLNPRAIECARLNAVLNGVDSKCEFRAGSLYQPVDESDKAGEDRKFDRILANPPFIPSARTGTERLLERDAGPGGDEILKPIVQGLLDHLNPSGWGTIMSYFTTRADVACEEEIKNSIGSDVPVDLLLLRFFTIEPEELTAWLTWSRFGQDFRSYSKRFRELLAALRSRNISALTNGVLAVRRSQNAASSFYQKDIPFPVRAQPEFIERTFSTGR